MPAVKGELKFDLSKIRAFEMADFFEANRLQDFRKMAATFAKCAVTVPEGWGDPAKPETFNRPMFGAGEGSFRWVIERFVADTQNVGE